MMRVVNRMGSGHMDGPVKLPYKVKGKVASFRGDVGYRSMIAWGRAQEKKEKREKLRKQLKAELMKDLKK